MVGSTPSGTPRTSDTGDPAASEVVATVSVPSPNVAGLPGWSVGSRRNAFCEAALRVKPVVGGSEDPITPPHLSRELAESLRGPVRLEIFDGCGHGAFHDDPVRVFALIRAFIAERSS